MVCWFTQNPSQGWRFLIHINSLRMQFKFKSNKPWNTETPRLATSWPLGERSEPFLAAKRPNASDEGLFWKSKKHRHKTDRNPPITNQKPWSIDWQLENTYSSFLRGQLRCKGQFRFWLTSQKTPNSEHVFDITGRVLSETTSRFSVKAKETRMKRVFHEPHFRT